MREKHRDPNRGDCDPERLVLHLAVVPAVGGLGETPRPEPRGLRRDADTPSPDAEHLGDDREKHRDPNRGDCDYRPQNSAPHSLQRRYGGETPRPEPRGLRLRKLIQRAFPDYRGRTEKHRDPNRGNCDRPSRTSTGFTSTFGREKHRDPNRGDCDLTTQRPCFKSAFRRYGETPRPEPRGLRLVLQQGFEQCAELCLLVGETPRPEPRGLRHSSGYMSGCRPRPSYQGRNTETRTEGIATPQILRTWWDGGSRSYGETPRPEPRGLRRVCEQGRADPDGPGLGETPGPEPRGLRPI